MTDRPSPRPSPSRRQATLPAANPARRLAALAAAGLGLALAACGGANGPGAGNAAAGAAAASASSSATLGTTAASGAAQRPPQTAFGGRVAEPASGWSDKPGWSSARSMIVAANPLAAQAGAEILKAGGSAVDAAIAAQLVLTLTEPQSSGLGGGALLLYADDKTTDAYDGLETAPAAATERLFLDRDGKLLGPAQTVAGGRPVGVPGTLRMLELAHRAHGKLPWKRLFQPAIKLADQGFPISPRLAALIAGDPYLRADPAARAYFYEQDGRPKTAGTLLRNPAYAATLRQLAAGGANPFYSGAIAREIAAKVGQSANPGLLTQQDLGRYRALPRTPFCGDYRKWTLCGMPPPASGGLAIAQMFGLFDGLPDWQKLGGQKLVRNDVGGLEPTPQAAHLFSEAGRLAYADRARYPADPERVPAPAGDWQRLVAPTYLAQRLQRIGDTSLGHAEAGVPADSTLATSFGDDPDALAPPPAASERGGRSRRRGGGDGLQPGRPVRLAADGARLPSQRCADGLLAHAARSRSADREPPGRRQAAAFLAHARDRLRARHAARGAGARRRRRDAGRQDAGRRHRLGPDGGAGDRPAELRLAQRADRAGSGTCVGYAGRGLEAARARGAARPDHLGPGRAAARRARRAVAVAGYRRSAA